MAGVCPLLPCGLPVGLLPSIFSSCLLPTQLAGAWYQQPALVSGCTPVRSRTHPTPGMCSTPSRHMSSPRPQGHSDCIRGPRPSYMLLFRFRAAILDRDRGLLVSGAGPAGLVVVENQLQQTCLRGLTAWTCRCTQSCACRLQRPRLRQDTG